MHPKITYNPTGIIKTPFSQIAEMPIQPYGAAGAKGIIELNHEYTHSLIDFEELSHLILLYHFHLVDNTKLLVIPFMDDKPHGISVRMIVKFQTIKNQ